MRKKFFILVFLALTTAAFAQTKIGLTGHLSASNNGAWPSIGVEIDVGPVDILAELEFWVDRDSFTGGEGSWSSWALEFYAGIAPKVEITEKLTLSIPILAKIFHYKEGYNFKGNRYIPDGMKGLSYNGFGLDLGARAYYALSKRWSIFAGFQVAAMTYQGEGKGKAWSSTGYIINVTENMSEMYFFNSGSFDLGIKFTF